MLQDYRYQLHLYIKTLKVKKCKGIPYKRICGENIFVEDIEKKVFMPLGRLMSRAEECNNPSELHYIVAHFNRKHRKRHGWTPKQYIEWVDAYKGAGAFFTMQNMIRFHGCTFKIENNLRMDKDASYEWLELKAEEYRGEGWRLLGLFRKFLVDNNIDIKKKMAEWRKYK